MNNHYIVSAFGAALLLSGCDEKNSAFQNRLENQDIIRHEPTKLGKLPDGRILSFYKLKNEENPNYEHFVYIVSGNVNNTVSTNTTERVGKRIEERVTVTIDGQNYKVQPLPEEPPK